MQIAARACYDTPKGIAIIRKMTEFRHKLMMAMNKDNIIEENDEDSGGIIVSVMDKVSTHQQQQTTTTTTTSWMDSHPSFDDRMARLEDAAKRFNPTTYGCLAAHPTLQWLQKQLDWHRVVSASDASETQALSPQLSQKDTVHFLQMMLMTMLLMLDNNYDDVDGDDDDIGRQFTLQLHHAVKCHSIV